MRSWKRVFALCAIQDCLTGFKIDDVERNLPSRAGRFEFGPDCGLLFPPGLGLEPSTQTAPGIGLTPDASAELISEEPKRNDEAVANFQ